MTILRRKQSRHPPFRRSTPILLGLSALLLAGGLLQGHDLHLRHARSHSWSASQLALVQTTATSSPPKGRTLVIVESPSKAKTIGKYLGSDYRVMASVGHIRDLAMPRDLPKRLKSGGYREFGVDINNGFTPYYIIPKDKREVVSRIRTALQHCSELLLATDADREGEAIAWHLLEVLQPKIPAKRMVFTEITKDAIQKAARSVRELDTTLVDAQEARRILDRVYGFTLCPVLWSRIKSGLSAGRVQTPALRLVVEREKERRSFTEASHWDLLAQFASLEGTTFEGSLTMYKGQKLARTGDFSRDGVLQKDVLLLDNSTLQTLQSQMADDAEALVQSITRTKMISKPQPPFTTSTLQQSAFSNLRLQPEETMRVAQKLYERGFISYMRTDSPSLSEDATKAAREEACNRFGKQAVPHTAWRYASGSKGAQEAHEAVRPSGTTFQSPEDLSSLLTEKELKLYRLIWQRTVASQMVASEGIRVKITSKVNLGAEGDIAEFETLAVATTSVGWKALYAENPGAEPFFDLKKGDSLEVKRTTPKSRKTMPPPRFTEASLVRELERKGIGRPSTYANILAVLFKRGYVAGQASGHQQGGLQPTPTGMAVVQLLENHCADLVEYEFTAKMEAALDRIAEGDEDRNAYLHGVYFGGPEGPGLQAIAQEAKGEKILEGQLPKVDTNISLGVHPETGHEIFACDGPEGSLIQMGSSIRRISSKKVLDRLNLHSAGALLASQTEKKPAYVRRAGSTRAKSATKLTGKAKTRGRRRVAS